MDFKGSISMLDWPSLTEAIPPIKAHTANCLRLRFDPTGRRVQKTPVPIHIEIKYFLAFLRFSLFLTFLVLSLLNSYCFFFSSFSSSFSFLTPPAPQGHVQGEHYKPGQVLGQAGARAAAVAGGLQADVTQ